MKTSRDKSNMGISFLLLMGVFLITSCGGKEYQKIPLENLDPKLKRAGSTIAKDIISSIDHDDGARYLLKKDYITPMVHGRIMHNLEMYNESFKLTSMTIGKIKKYKLFQVVDKRIIKTTRYKLETDADGMKFIELRIDINNNYGLADFYLYVTSKDGLLQRQNLFPVAVK